MKTMNKTSFIFSHCIIKLALVSFDLVGMAPDATQHALTTQEHQLPRITIVDHEHDESITSLIPNPSVIGVFGATPRYAQFVTYKETLQKNAHALITHYQHSKHLKGVTGANKAFIRTIESCPWPRNI